MRKVAEISPGPCRRLVHNRGGAACRPPPRDRIAPVARILVIDNYDSFVYNIVSYLAQIGASTQVWRNDDPRFAEAGWEDAFDGVLLSPGPGTPERAGVCVDVIRQVGGRTPLFGVCLGLQAMVVALGGVVGRASELLHGKVSPVNHDSQGIFAGLPSPINTTRYHSLAAVEDTMPAELEVTARTESGVIMAIRHREWPMEAVQFHPESVLTEGGYQMLANWLVTCDDTDAPARAAGFAPLATTALS